MHSVYWAALAALGMCLVVLDVLLLLHVNSATDAAAMQANLLGGAAFSAEVRRLVRDEAAVMLLAASESNTMSGRVGSNDE